MPMQSRHVPMSVEEYELLPFEPGWKCEYYDGQAHFTPRDHPVITTLQIAPRLLNALCPLRPARSTDADELIEAVTEFTPDVAVVDIRMPPTFTDEGLVAAVALRRSHPEVGVLVFSQWVETRYATELLAGNAEGVG